MPLADCRLCPSAPELELQVFGAGRRGVPVEQLVGQIEPLGGQAAPKGVAAV